MHAQCVSRPAVVDHLGEISGIAVTADFHSALPQAAKLYSELKLLRDSGWILIDAGDFFGHDFSNKQFGMEHWDLIMFRELYHYSVPGNHGYSKWTSGLITPTKRLCANIYPIINDPFPLVTAVTFSIGGQSGVILGSIGEQAFSSIPAALRVGEKYEPARKCICRVIEAIRDVSALQPLVISHAGFENDLMTFSDLPIKSIVVSSHCHSSQHFEEQNGIIFIKPSEYGAGIVKIIKGKIGNVLTAIQHRVGTGQASASGMSASLNSALEAAMEQAELDKVTAAGAYLSFELTRYQLSEKLMCFLNKKIGVPVWFNQTCLREGVSPGVLSVMQLKEIDPFDTIFVIVSIQPNILFSIIIDPQVKILSTGFQTAYPVGPHTVDILTTTYLFENYLRQHSGTMKRILFKLKDAVLECLADLSKDNEQ